VFDVVWSVKGDSLVDEPYEPRDDDDDNNDVQSQPHVTASTAENQVTSVSQYVSVIVVESVFDVVILRNFTLSLTAYH